MPARAGVKRGKLYPEQGQIGGRQARFAGKGALPSPRVGRMSRRVTGGLRWMAIAVPFRRGGTELGLQAALADVTCAHSNPDVGVEAHVRLPDGQAAAPPRR